MDFETGQKPKCETHHKEISLLCLSPKCTHKLCYMCDDPDCTSKHQHPTRQFISVQKLQQMVSDNFYSLDHLLPKVDAYFFELKTQIISHLDKQQSVLKYLINRTQYCSEENVYTTLKHFQGKQYFRMTPTTTQALIDDISSISRKAEILQRVKFYEKELSQLQTRIKALTHCKQYNDLTLLNNFKKAPVLPQLDSRILSKNQITILTSLCRKAGLELPSNPQLVYRGSDNNFSAEEYHKAVDSEPHSLTIVQTSRNFIFGAYLHCKVSQQNDWIPDVSRKSFLFSLNHNTVHPLKKDMKARAAFGGLKNGPQIGSGCDLYICDKCHLFPKSGSSLGGSYELPQGMKERTEESDRYLAGEKSFVVKEYEIFSIKG